MSGNETQIYRDLMRLKPDDLTPNAWAVKSGVSRTVWTDMRRHGNPSRKTLEKLLAAAGSSLAEFEALRVGDAPGDAPGTPRSRLGDVRARPWSEASATPLPLVATDFGGEWTSGDLAVELIAIRKDQIIDRVSRPPSLAGHPDAYALTIVGDSMWPRFRPGRRVAVSPGTPVALGDDILVQMAGEGTVAGGRILAMVKELVRLTGSYIEVRQFNPDATFRVPASEVAVIHKVVGELI